MLVLGFVWAAIVQLKDLDLQMETLALVENPFDQLRRTL